MVCTEFKYSSEAQFQMLYNIFPDALYIEKEGKIMFVNDAALRLWAANDTNQLINKPIFELFHNSLRTTVEKVRSSLLNDENVQQFPLTEMTILRLDGIKVQTEVCAKSVVIDGEKLIQVFVRDISEKKKSQRHLAENQRLFKSLMSNIQGVILRYRNDENLTVEFISDGSINLLGYKPKDLLENRLVSFSEIIVPEYRKQLNRSKVPVKGNLNYSIEYEVICKTGQRKWVWEQSSAILNLNGEIVGFEGFVSDVTEIVENRSKLKSSESKFKMLTENMRDVVWIIDPVSEKYLYISPAIDGLLGYTTTEMLKSNCFNHYVKDDNLDKIRKQFSQRTADLSKNPYTSDNILVYEAEYIHKDGSLVIVEVTTRFYRNDDTKKIEVHGVTHNITKRKHNEQTLINAKEQAEESEHMYKSLNQEFEVLNEELRQSNDELITAKNELEEREHALQLKNEEYEVVNEELRLANEDLNDTKRALEDREQILQERNKGYESINEELIQTNEYLFETKVKVELSEAALKEAQILAKIGNWEFNVAKNSFVFSDNALQILRISPENGELSLENFIRIMHPDDAGYFNFAFKNHLTYNEKFDVVCRIDSDSDIQKYINVRCRTEYSPEGDPSHVLGVIVDISDRVNTENELREAKEKAEESDKLKSAFLANMSHEIRTPLNAIIGFSDLLYESTLKDINVLKDKVERYSLVINRRGNDLLNIINDILDISKIQANQMVLNEKSNNVNELLDEVYDLFMVQEIYLLKKDKVDLRITSRVPFDQEFALIDEKRVKQVVINLVSNALKFTTEGSVSFGAYIDNQNLAFFVEDTGIGIPEEKQRQIFEPFIQLYNIPDKKNPDGTGLGLSICTGFAKLMKGDLMIESTVNEGSTFTFTIPYRTAVDPAASVEKNEKVVYNWGSRTILIVEDDEYCSDYLVEILSSTNVNVVQSTTVHHAISIMKNRDDIDLILMDVRLPDGDGNELTRIIKKQNPNVYIIAQTANAMENDRVKSINSGCDEYIAKPIKQADLLKIIGRFLKEG